MMGIAGKVSANVLRTFPKRNVKIAARKSGTANMGLVVHVQVHTIVPWKPMGSTTAFTAANKAVPVRSVSTVMKQFLSPGLPFQSKFLSEHVLETCQHSLVLHTCRHPIRCDRL